MRYFTYQAGTTTPAAATASTDGLLTNGIAFSTRRIDCKDFVELVSSEKAWKTTMMPGKSKQSLTNTLPKQ